TAAVEVLLRFAGDNRDKGRTVKGYPGFFILASLMLGTACAQDAVSPEFDPDYGVGQAKSLTLDEGEIIYLEKGEGVPVVFYNPLPDYRYWQWQVEATARSYHAVAFYFPASAIDRTPEGLAAALDAH